ncbi:cell division protein FtsL [Halanaerobacter jeridensis]|uniref:Cell division protein FtsL n=1 Tax=Halanaerobacter jeridensis TaxID=706427 RepID=A0A938XUC8_9FIRM|nr:cell division protein FtsL [Halanaerobacter jeridensis]MBM7557941.1 cell division protein FtsL [Halanaerobacter jeridensis]
MRSEKLQDYSGSQYSRSQNRLSTNSSNKITNSKTMLMIIFIIFVIVLFFIMYINQYVQLSRKSFMVEKLEDKKRKLESKKEHLQLKIAKLKSLERVERIAKQELNMEQPDNINYIVINAKEESEGRKSREKTKMTKNQESNKKNKLSLNLEEKVENWVKDLTTVQAGTLKKE